MLPRPHNLYLEKKGWNILGGNTLHKGGCNFFKDYVAAIGWRNIVQMQREIDSTKCQHDSNVPQSVKKLNISARQTIQDLITNQP